MHSSRHPRHTNTTNIILKANNTRRHRPCSNLHLASSVRRRSNNTDIPPRKDKHTKPLTSHRNSSDISNTRRLRGIRRAGHSLLAVALHPRS